MEIQYYLTEADILELMRYRLHQTRGLKDPVLVNRIVYLIAFILLAIGSLTIAKDSLLPILFMILATVLFFLYPAFFDWNLKRKVARAYHDERMRATLASRSLCVANEGLVETSSFGETRINWDTINGLEVTSAYTFISIQTVPSIIIPGERVSMGDYEAFTVECRKHIKEISA